MTNTISLPLVHRTLAPRTGQPPHPALALLHGRGANELDLLSLGPALDDRLFVICPRAPRELTAGAYEWYDLEAVMSGRSTPETSGRAMELLDGFLERVPEAYPIDPARLFIGGFSQGGSMSAAAMMSKPERFAGGLVLSGFLPVDAGPPTSSGRISLPVFQGHGLYDQLLAIELGRMLRDFLLAQGTDLTYREYPMGHEVSQAELLDVRAWMGAALGGEGDG